MERTENDLSLSKGGRNCKFHGIFHFIELWSYINDDSLCKVWVWHVERKVVCRPTVAQFDLVVE